MDVCIYEEQVWIYRKKNKYLEQKCILSSQEANSHVKILYSFKAA